jgi:hypothetical protein
MRHEIELLMDGADPQSLCRVRIMERDWLAIEENFPRIWLVDPGKDLDQS